MEELILSEQMSINGGGINASMVWYNLYGAFAKHGCAYPVGYKSTWKERNRAICKSSQLDCASFRQLYL